METSGENLWQSIKVVYQWRQGTADVQSKLLLDGIEKGNPDIAQYYPDLYKAWDMWKNWKGKEEDFFTLHQFAPLPNHEIP